MGRSVGPYDPYGPGASGNDFDVITGEPATVVQSSPRVVHSATRERHA